jgi:phage shock protein PspC (stress-responsive transcriptional regulator)
MMDKTIKLNIAGTLFQIDEEAYRILRDYLQAIDKRFRNVQGGHETIEDIESRIAEIFQSQKGLAGVISKDNVEAMISMIGKPEDFDHNEVRNDPPFYSSQGKRMYRNPDDKIIGGVCSGIGTFLNTNPVLFRILFVIAAFFGVGIFVYIALWIALPSADSDSLKKETYGSSSYPAGSQNRQTYGTASANPSEYDSGYYNTSKVGDAFNEIFRAVGRIFYIVLRIFLIITGIIFVLTGFLFILCLVMIFVFKYPGAFSSDTFVVNLGYFPDLINYIINPALTPWILILTCIVLLIPMLALIYWGVKMIFWFKAKDGVVSLVGLVIWVLSIAALAMILFREGINFAESAVTTTQNIFPGSPDTIYVVTDHKVADLKFSREFSLPDKNEYALYINDEKKELYIHPFIDVNNSETDVSRVEISKRSSGLSKSAATIKSEELIYNYNLKGNTLLLDEYFTIPSGRKWSADIVAISIYVPEGTILKFDSSSENLLKYSSGYEEDDVSDKSELESGSKLWILSKDGIKHLKNNPVKHK